MSFQYKQTLARFRTSTHSLMIEKGRHSGLDRNFRYCPVCLQMNISVVETETHFFVECTLYNDIRNSIFGHNYFSADSLNKFYRTMSSNDPDTIYKTARFLSKAFETRKHYIDSIDYFT